MSGNNQTASINFYGQKLITVEQDGTIFVAMKPICEGMGLNWSGQQQKIRNNKEKFGCMDIHIPTKGGIQEMLCIPLSKLNGWLFSINPMKVRIEIRATVELYQEECFVALYDYWHKGAAINPRAVPKENREADALRDITIKLLADETESAFRNFRKYAIMGNEGRLEINATIRFRLGTDLTESPGITDLGSDKPEEYLTPTELGKKFGCSAKKANKLLLEKGLQTSFRDAKGELCYEPTEKGMPFAVFGDTGKKQITSMRKGRLLWKKSVIPLLKEEENFQTLSA